MKMYECIIETEETKNKIKKLFKAFEELNKLIKGDEIMSKFFCKHQINNPSDPCGVSPLCMAYTKTSEDRMICPFKDFNQANCICRSFSPNDESDDINNIGKRLNRLEIRVENLVCMIGRLMKEE